MFAILYCAAAPINTTVAINATDVIVAIVDEHAVREEECHAKLPECAGTMSPQEYMRIADKLTVSQSYCHTLAWCEKKVRNLAASNSSAEIAMPFMFFFFFVVFVVLSANDKRR